ncbi:MAG TPA: hypothetical protein VNA14_05845 [Mycobacteriales bacterium]|nr:hypothetical protein [Mycobacteriales bacterium]
MRNPARFAALLVVAALLGGCSDGGGGAETADTQAASADAIVLMKAGATDLNALDLRDKLVPLEGVSSVVYDQAARRLRINFTDKATAENRSAAVAVAQEDPAVERVREAGKEDKVNQQPAPGGGATGGATQAPAPTP